MISTMDGIVAGLKPLVPYLKATTPAQAAGRTANLARAAGNPGPATLGTPGINGVAVDNTSAIKGYFPLPTPPAAAYLASLKAMSVANMAQLILYDLLWYNTGLVITTTGAQAITFPGLPSRCPVGDGTFDANGLQCEAWLMATGVTGNGGAITNTTISYTDNATGAGRTGTLFPDWPAAAVTEHISPFALAAGDGGVKSIQSITLGTSYVSGTISLLVVRQIASIMFPSPTLQGGIQADAFMLGMPQIAPASALFFAYNAGAAAGGALYGQLGYTYG